MANPDIAINKVLIHEGGYHNGKGDYGGETKWGISRKQYPEVDIKGLSRTEAARIYKRDYWDKIKGDQIKSQAIANELMDTAVNMHWRRAVKFLQEALNLLFPGGAEESLRVDGLIGSKTLARLHMYLASAPYAEGVLLIALDGQQFEHYWKQARKDPRQRRWLAGWLNQRIRNEEA